MGLDMYLNKRSYVQQWDHHEKSHAITVKFDGKARKDIKKNRITYVTEQVMYWRKANHIHNWFIRRLEAPDNCKPMEISIKDLVALCSDCEKVIDNPEQASEILPCASGFFFGSLDYDRFYFSELKQTAKELKKIIKECYEARADGHFIDLYYEASW